MIREPWIRSFLRLCRRWGPAVLLCAGSLGWSETLRVASWDLAGGPGEATRDWQIVAETLNRLAPDLVLLQSVKDWKSCQELAAVLKPGNYAVLLCSSFKGRPQVAVISRHKAYFTWAEAWESGASGGFAFAAVSVGNRRVGFFSAGLDPVREAAVGDQTPERLQVLKQLETVKGWVTNKPQSFVIGGKVSSWAGLLGEVGFGRAEVGESEPQLLGEAIFVNPRQVVLPTGGAAVSLSSRRLVVCELELDPAQAEVLKAAREKADREASAREEQARLKAQVANTTAPKTGSSIPAPVGSVLAQGDPASAAVRPNFAGKEFYWTWGLAGMGGAVALAGFVVWRRRRRESRSGLANVARGEMPSTYVVMAPRSVTGSSTAVLVSEEAPLVQVEPSAVAPTHSETWRYRALAAESEVRRAEAVVRQGLLPHLVEFLKLRFVKRLLTDRKELMDASESASLKALEVDERLARIERQIQEQNRAYEMRIDDLTRELQEARAENRELIRARIAQVKAEMESARERLLTGKDYSG